MSRLSLQGSSALVATAHHQGLPPLSKTLINFLNVGFYTLQYPYHLSFSKETGEVKVSSSSCTKGLYLVVAIMAEMCVIVVQGFSVLTQSLKMESDRREFQCFLANLINCGWLMATAIAKLELWRSSNRIQLVFHTLITMERKLQNWTPHLLWIFKYPLLTAVFAHVNMVATTLLEMSQGYQQRNGSAETPIEHQLLGYTTNSIFTQGLVQISIFYETQMFHFASRMVCLLSLIMLSLGHSYSKCIRGMTSDEETLDVCKNFIRLSCSMKICFEMTILGSCLLLLPYFAMRLQDVGNGGWTDQVLYLSYALILFLTLFTAAEGHSKISSCVVVLKTNGGDLANGNLVLFSQRTIILQVADGGGVGIRSRCVTLTYPVFAAVMASILTYAISIMQFQFGD